MASSQLDDSTIEPEKLARLARLRYVSDSDHGYSREMNGKGFRYFNVRRNPLKNRQHVVRIERLAIPPAWTDVWICRFATGHLQATGFDSRKRKQYLYHERWRHVADSAKFLRLTDFGRLLPKLRLAVTRNLRGKELSRERVLAGMVAVLDTASIRVGNEEYVRENNSFGLSTLRTRHVTNKNGSVELRFRAKGGFHREVAIHDKRLVRLLRQLKRLRGAHVFQFRDDEGAIREVDSMQVNDFLRELSGHSITAKDFRTWKASALAAGRLYDQRDVEPLAARKKVIKQVIAEVAEVLTNTPAVCRKSYIHPGLFATYEAGHFPNLFRRSRRGDPTGLAATNRFSHAFCAVSIRQDTRHDPRQTIGTAIASLASWSVEGAASERHFAAAAAERSRDLDTEVFQNRVSVA